MSENEVEKINIQLENMKEANKAIKDDVKDIKRDMITQDGMDLANEKLCAKILKTIKEEYISKAEFKSEITPLKKVIYGTVTIVGVAIVTAIVGSVIK